MHNKILVVEDNGLVAVELTTVLESFGYDVIAQVRSGQAAIDAATEQEVDLVLMDIMLLGEMDGITAAEAIYNTNKTPIIFLSAYSDEAYLKRAVNADPYGYLVKPFRENELRSTIEMALNKSHLQQALLKKNAELEQLTAELSAKKAALEYEIAHSTHLQQKNTELEQFAYIASHDLQAPLRTVRAYTTMLREKYSTNTNETVQISIRFIIEAVDRMSGLIKDLLDYSRLGKNAELKEVDCNQLLKIVQQDLATTIDETNAIIQIQELPSIKGYETELRLLFQNLIDNAIKFRKPDVVPELMITAEVQQTQWKFSIKDNGIGIDPQYHDRIFMIFQRLHGNKQFKGSGIGLAHCKKIIELHGGTITVDSQENEGSTFYINIPRLD